MVLGFAHPCLVVANAEAVKDFYCKMFGFSVISEESWAGQATVDAAINVCGSEVSGYMLAGHNCFLEIHQYVEPKSKQQNAFSFQANDKGIRHLAFLVDDCTKEASRFVKLGGELFSQPVEMAPSVYAVYGRDPFGHIIELCEPMGDNEKLTSLPGITAQQDFQGKD